MFEMIGDTLKYSGGWGWIIALAGAALYVLIVIQFLKVKTKDYRAIMWGLFIFVIIAGVTGTLVGMVQACLAVASVETAEQITMLSRGFSIGALTACFSGIICGWGVIPLAIASDKVAKWQKAAD